MRRTKAMTIVGTVAVALVASLSVALAQSPAPSPSPGPGKREWVEPPAQLPRLPRGEQTRNIDTLFGALKAAPDATSGKAIEDRIWAIWAASGSDTVSLLMTRAKAALDKDDHDLALRLLDAVVEIRPGYAEGWNRRATVFFLKKNYAASLADLRQVLRREPRHFGALAGLGTIMEEIGDEANALAAFRKAAEVHPHLKGIGDRVKALTEKVEGRPI